MIFTYKGYTGEVGIDAEADVLSGEILDIRDVVTFEGDTVAEARQAFEDSVDDYLDFCAEIGKKPNKPFSGKLPFRTTPDRHRNIYLAAKKQGKSINSWMDETLGQAAEKELEKSC